MLAIHSCEGDRENRRCPHFDPLPVIAECAHCHHRADLLTHVCAESIAMPAESILICVYEDGERFECPLSEWTAANADDAETLANLPRMQAGEIITFGGGAAPLSRVWLETPAQQCLQARSRSVNGYRRK